jgi:hypothetical protein
MTTPSRRRIASIELYRKLKRLTCSSPWRLAYLQARVPSSGPTGSVSSDDIGSSIRAFTLDRLVVTLAVARKRHRKIEPLSGSVMRGLNRYVEPGIDAPRKETHWGKWKLKGAQ